MKRHRYRLTVEHISDSRGGPVHNKPLQFEVMNHDDIIAVVTWLRERGDFSDKESAAALGVGLKLLGGVLLDNKGNPLFSSFLPHLYQFVKELKAGTTDSQGND